MKELSDERALLSDVNGAITVAAMCDAFLNYGMMDEAFNFTATFGVGYLPMRDEDLATGSGRKRW